MTTIAAAAPFKARTWRLRLWKELRAYPAIPVVILAIVIFLAIFGGALSPHSPYDQALRQRLLPPVGMDRGTWDHALGTDNLGRDTLSRMMTGARVSLSLAALTIAVGVVLGTVIGAAAGFYAGRLWDMILMRLADAALSIPLVLLALVLAVVRGASYWNLVILISLFIWARTARIIRGQALQVCQRDYIALARVAGCSGPSILFRHVIPNVSHVAIVLATLEVGAVIILEASLSFLGVGVPPPNPSWGAIVADGRGVIASAWWVATVPGIAIMITVASFNLIGDRMRDRFDPRLRQRGA
ncbi:MAG: ABC transporter permease [Dehalococcoidia bacterium]|nr:ABC transporter permease [Dehalococcoidia bacterium]